MTRHCGVFSRKLNTSAFKVMARRNKSTTTSCFFSPSASLIKDSQWAAEYSNDALPESTEPLTRRFFEHVHAPLSSERNRGARVWAGDFLSIMLALTPTLGRFVPKELPFASAFFDNVDGFASREDAANTMGAWKEPTVSADGLLWWWGADLPV
jgi:hypothetical protein